MKEKNADEVKTLLDKPDLNMNLQNNVSNYNKFYNYFDMIILIFITISNQVKSYNIIYIHSISVIISMFLILKVLLFFLIYVLFMNSLDGQFFLLLHSKEMWIYCD